VIAYVAGTLATKAPEAAIIDVQGVGYRVLIPASTFAALPAVGQGVKLHTYHYVREDDVSLYGFATEAERAVFETMLGVSRVGPKLALAALSSMSPVELRDHVLEGDPARLTGISGVGRKTAERLIIELRDRFADLDVFEGTASAPLSGGSDARRAARADALAALESLGLSRAEAERALRKVLRADAGVQSADELVRRALKAKD
jgi:Holliday junction DNA helicase RuvA